MAGFFGIGNFEREGPGVSKDEVKKKGIGLFFEIYFRAFWKLVELNILYIIFCIPIITIGPATAAMTKVLRNYSQERHVFLFSDFLEAFKENFKQSFIVGIINIILIYVLSISMPFYKELANKSGIYIVALMVLMVALIIFINMQFYVYIMIVSTTLRLKDTIKNSFLLAISQLKTNVIIIFSIFLIILPLYILFPISIILVVLFSFSLIGLVVCFNAYPIINKYVIQPFYDKSGEDNPEKEN